jgi:hypothetical protein
MQPSEALGIGAQVAVTLAGFAGVVVVFRPDSLHQWSRLDRFRLRLLLTNSIYPLIFSIFGILLLTIQPPPESIWRWCSALAAAFEIPFAMVGFKTAFSLVPGEFKNVSKVMFYPLVSMAIAATALQFFNLLY